MSDEDLLRRAFAAYFRAGDSMDQPGATASTVQKHKGLRYVVLRNNYRTLAVYRVKADGILRRLRRWPKELEKS